MAAQALERRTRHSLRSGMCMLDAHVPLSRCEICFDPALEEALIFLHFCCPVIHWSFFAFSNSLHHTIIENVFYMGIHDQLTFLYTQTHMTLTTLHHALIGVCHIMEVAQYPAVLCPTTRYVTIAQSD